MQNISVLITGIGGQGIILASDVLADAAMRTGWDVKKTDSIGMAQRGGSVISHVRMGDVVSSPLIPTGGADVLFGMEKLEAARHCHFLKPGGQAVINSYGAPPLTVATGAKKYPEDEAILSVVRERAGKVFFIDGLKKVSKLGNTRALNVFLLGALSVLLPLTEQVWQEALEAKLPSKILQINLQAFLLGREEINDACIR